MILRFFCSDYKHFGKYGQEKPFNISCNAADKLEFKQGYALGFSNLFPAKEGLRSVNCLV